MTTIQARTNFTPLSFDFGLQDQLRPAHTQRAAGLLSLFGDSFSMGPMLPQPGGFGLHGLLPPPVGFNPMALNQAISQIGGFQGLQGFGLSDRLCHCMCHMHHHHMPMSVGNFMQGVQKAEGNDKFATHQSCRTGKHNPSNLNNSDHIKLALYDLLNKQSTTRGGHKSFKDWNEAAKKLESEYGIKAEVTTVKSKEGDTLKALKFENGAVFADGAGDGQLDMGDYNFKGAIADIEKRYGAKADDLIKSMKETKQAYDANPYLQQFGGIEDMYANSLNAEKQSNELMSMYKKALGPAMEDPGLAGLYSQMGGLGSPFFPTNEIFAIFAQAYMLAR